MNNEKPAVTAESMEKIPAGDKACRDCARRGGSSCQDWCGNPAYPKCMDSCPLYDN